MFGCMHGFAATTSVTKAQMHNCWNYKGDKFIFFNLNDNQSYTPNI